MSANADSPVAHPSADDASYLKGRLAARPARRISRIVHMARCRRLLLVTRELFRDTMHRMSCPQPRFAEGKMPEDKKQRKKAPPPDPLEGRTFPSGWKSARWVILRRKLVLRAWHILLAVWWIVDVFWLVHVRSNSNLTGRRNMVELVVYAVAGIILLVALYSATRRLDFLRFVWCGKESWRNLYRWDDVEKWFVRLRRRPLFETRAGRALAIYLLMSGAMIPTLSSTAFRDRFYTAPYYAEFVSVMREGPSDEWQAFVVWEVRGHFFKGRNLAIGSGGTKDDGMDHHYSYRHFPARVRSSRVSRTGPQTYPLLANMRWSIEEFCKDRPEPSSRDKGSIAYTLVFRDLERGRLTAENLSADELRRAGVSMKMIDRMLDEPLQNHP